MQLEIIQNNYVFVPGFISQDEARSLTNQFKEHCKKFDRKNVDDPSQHVHSEINWLPFIRLLVQKIPEVSQIVGEEVLPTYTYARWQTKGHDLPRHRDRPSCEISLSLNLKKDKDWGFWIQKPTGEEICLPSQNDQHAVYIGCRNLNVSRDERRGG